MDSKVASALETIARSARRPARPQRAILLVLWTSAPCVERASVNRPAIISPSTTFEIREMGHTPRVSRCWRRHAKCLSARSRSEDHTSELQSLMRISYAVFCLKQKYHIQFVDNTQHKT